MGLVKYNTRPIDIVDCVLVSNSSRLKQAFCVSFKNYGWDKTDFANICNDCETIFSGYIFKKIKDYLRLVAAMRQLSADFEDFQRL